MTLKKAPENFKKDKPLYKPVKSDKTGKKGMVYVKATSGGNTRRLIHFGDANMKDFRQHGDAARRKNYLERSGGIRDKSGNLTANNKNSANYWSRKILWNA
jgi:hypothetical protein